MHARLGALGGIGQADRHLGMHILTGGGTGEILLLKRRAETARTAARAAKHVAQNVFEAAGTTAAAPALKAVRSETEALEMRAARSEARAAARLRAVAFVTLEARLALGVDFAVVERLALLVVAGDLVGGIQLGEARGRLGIVLVGVGMQLLGEPPVGALDLSLARTLRYPQNLVGVAHPSKLP